MPHDPVSRRQFLHNAATSSAGVALGTSLAAPHSQWQQSQGIPAAIAHTMESYPIAEPSRARGGVSLKIVSMENHA